MKIIFTLDKPNLYGSERHVLGLIMGLKLNYDVEVVTFDSGPLLEKLTTHEIKYNVIKHSWLPSINTYRLFRLFNHLKPDVIHAHQPKAFFWSAIVARLLGIPCIITIHSLPSSNIQSYNSLMLKLLVGSFHYAVIFFSEILANKIIYLSRFSFNTCAFKKKAIIIPNWIDVYPQDHIEKNETKFPLRFISVGTVTYNKGMDRLIDCLVLIKEFDWQINIVGDGDAAYIQSLIDKCMAYGISDRVKFLGYQENISKLLADADVFILLSRGETFGLVYIEAMVHGLTVVSWDIPVVKEIMPNGNIVLNNDMDIFKLFNEILINPQKLSDQGVINRKFVLDKFQFQNVLINYKKLYDQVLFDNIH